MLAYRSAGREIRPAAEAAALANRIQRLSCDPLPPEHLRDLAIDAGAFESACVDAWSPREDDWAARHATLRELSRRLARAWLAADKGLEPREPLADLPALLEGLDSPRTAVVSRPEGYAFYALYPEMFVAAVESWARGERPGRAVCIGVRSIGTSLSACVEAALDARGWQTWSCTVRPRGHPFDRRIELGPELARELRRRREWTFFIVDEGPGLSGSSFASAARMLAGLGVPDERILFVASWPGDPEAFKSRDAADRWRRHRVLTGSFERAVLARGLHGIPPVRLSDVGAGQWRGGAGSSPAVRPPVQPQLERRKYLTHERHPRLLAFEGIGDTGRRALARATDLASHGFVPEPERLENGFLRSRWIAGERARYGEADPALLEAVARYLAHLQCQHRTGSAADPSALEPLLEANVTETLGSDAARAAARIPRPAPEAAPAVRLDARMQPHEWVRSDRGLVKTDALHHHDDHFHPGPHDIAWDLAGAIVEFGWTEPAAEAVLDEYVRLSGDSHVRQRLPYYRLAYLAFRLGMCALAVDRPAGDPEREGFARLAAGYRAALAAALRGSGAGQILIPPVSLTASTSGWASNSRSALTDTGAISMRRKRSSGTPRK